ncbi:hypothetical protein BofuT4_P031880.1 [Botrytis cinerea T4]|uniref:Uncharacterized protein n=1 Tax=Botryotinia fuckeliana (strain T4) TaxID=999810 RepID=G2Y9N6_BOTF4|nr:hypothetical protein BofuT4_P031880.1 [Botrytis cinerea T4]
MDPQDYDWMLPLCAYMANQEMVATARVTMASSYHFHQLAVFQISNSPSLPQFLETGYRGSVGTELIILGATGARSAEVDI